MEVINLVLTKGTAKDFQIALVDRPAIESDFLAFSKKERFKVISEEKRIISGYAMIAELPIERVDDKGNSFFVKFTSESIKNIVEEFFKNSLTTQTNANHETNNFLEGVYVLESFMIDKDRGIQEPKGYDKVSDGSWFVSMKVENDEVWKSVKDGTFKGFSVEGVFDKNEELTEEEEDARFLQAMEDFLNSL